MRWDGAGYGELVIRVRAGTAACCALLALSGCAPSTPSAAEWRASARQALEDTASEVRSVALVIELETDDRLPARSAQVAAVESEESLATVQQTLSTQQPPAGSERQDREVSDLEERAADLVRRARIALTAGDAAAYDEVRVRLLALSDDLEAERRSLR